MPDKPMRIPATLCREVLDRIGDKAVRKVVTLDVIIEYDGTTNLLESEPNEVRGSWVVTGKDSRK